jgi:hypothetical protein
MVSWTNAWHRFPPQVGVPKGENTKPLYHKGFIPFRRRAGPRVPMRCPLVHSDGIEICCKQLILSSFLGRVIPDRAWFLDALDKKSRLNSQDSGTLLLGIYTRK